MSVCECLSVGHGRGVRACVCEVCLYACMYMFVYLYVYVCGCVCMYVVMCVYM